MKKNLFDIVCTIIMAIIVITGIGIAIDIICFHKEQIIPLIFIITFVGFPSYLILKYVK